MSLIPGVILTLLLYYVILFVVAQVIHNNSIVDIAWGAGFVLMAWVSFLLGDNNPVGTLIVVLITIWGLRLSWHIGKRNIGRPEDPRYVAMREGWGDRFPLLKAFGQVFLLQGFLMFLIGSPVLLTHRFWAPRLTLLSWLGLAVWIGGFLFESVGDAQLRAFLRKPENRGHIIRSGLWRYTRHPNYFGESTRWWGIFLIALTSVPLWMAVVSPVVITWLLVFVSGVPLTEKSFEGNEEFAAYARVTSRFFPWFPRRED